MAAYRDELSLAWCILLNALVFASAYRFALRRMTEDRGQAVLDAGLLGYAIQYLAVGVPGLLELLNPWSMTAVATLLAVALFVASFKTAARSESAEVFLDGLKSSRSSRWIVMSAALFTLAFSLASIYAQSPLPVMSNDALTYHFPAAVQWLQTRGESSWFPVWFFNPSNTYSPLGGSGIHRLAIKLAQHQTMMCWPGSWNSRRCCSPAWACFNSAKNSARPTPSPH